MTNADIAIEVKKLNKQFTLYHNGAFSLKHRIIGVFHKKHRQEIEYFNALKEISFAVKSGQSLALMGHNGSGKSTLMQILAGILKPSEGTVFTKGRIAPLIEIGAGFHPELTGLENIFLNASLYGLSNKEIRSKLNAIIQFSELENFIDIPLKNYSSGMYMRLGFSVAIHIEPDILLADEVLAVGDAAFQKKCHQRIHQMQKNGMTLILVTHSIEDAKKFCTAYIKLDHGKIIDSGNFHLLEAEALIC